MRVEAYLRRYRDLRCEVADYRERIKRITAQCENMTARLDGMPHGDGASGAGDRLLAVLADLKTQCDEKDRSSLDAYADIYTFLDELKNAKFKGVLLAIYAYEIPLRDLPKYFGKSESWCRGVRRTALKAAQELYDQKFPEGGAEE